eukprot:4590018-Pleurochrysis_carterae.AAC.2
MKPCGLKKDTIRVLSCNDTRSRVWVSSEVRHISAGEIRACARSSFALTRASSCRIRSRSKSELA